QPADGGLGPATEVFLARFQVVRGPRARRAENQGVDEPRAVRVLATEGKLGLENLLEAADRVALGGHNSAEVLDQVRERDRNQGFRQALLAPEIVVERRLGDPGTFDDFPNRRCIIALRCKQACRNAGDVSRRRVQNALPICGRDRHHTIHSPGSAWAVPSFLIAAYRTVGIMIRSGLFVKGGRHPNVLSWGRAAWQEKARALGSWSSQRQRGVF